MKKIELYTDGACSGNPGAGGWGCVLFYNKNKKELSGFEAQTTNNRMELYAVIMGLSVLKENCEVNIYTDSAYVFNAFEQKWIENWQNNGWRNSKKDDVMNQDLWQTLLALIQKHKVIWHKVKGHADNQWNNLCDKLATDEIKNNKKED